MDDGLSIDDRRLLADTRRVIPRFHAPDARATGDEIALPDEEAEHATRVLRLGPGAAIRVFDGQGHEYDAQVVRATKSSVLVRVDNARSPAAAEPSVAVTLAIAVLKGDKMDDVVRDAVMIGAGAILPLVTERAEVSLASLARAHRQERWTRIAISSTKQCGRAVVPDVLAPMEFAALASALEQRAIPLPALMLVEPSAAADVVSVSALDPRPPKEATIIVGPEGGWTAQEIERVSGTCRFVRLGSRTLRADRAPLVALSALLTVWRDL
jgi:16S rRNA (uracil1498-N3)-methyltransferase